MEDNTPIIVSQAPKKVFEKKKVLIKSNLVVWYILGLINTLLIFRLILKALGANPNSGFANAIYAITNPLVLPFSGILQTFVLGNSIVELSTIVAALVYLSIAWGIVYLLQIVYPITPKDVEKSNL